MISRIYKQVNIKIDTALTATASEVILSRVREILFPDSSPAVISANPDRPNIHYRVIQSISKSHDLSRLITGDSIKNAPGDLRKAERPILIFNRSRTGAELTARYLRQKLADKNIYFYHAGLSKREKKNIENWFYNSTDGILSSTCAYGMGVDKGNIRTVIHLEPSPSVEAYLQESGRAGRDKKTASAILLVSGSDFAYGHKIKNRILRERYLIFLNSITDITKCRRTSLLNLLGADKRNCSGCDVCDRNIKHSIDGLKEITGYLKKYNRKTTRREAILTLSGIEYPEVFRNGCAASCYFGLLCNWTEKELREAINTLVQEGKVRIPEHGLYKKTLIYKKISPNGALVNI